MANPDDSSDPSETDGPSNLIHDENFFPEEVRLANRNRGMPLEALAYPVTPTGMHYMLTHFDIPEVEAGSWRLEIGGSVKRPMSLTLDAIEKRPAVTHTVTLECAGNGRALLSPRYLSQPWYQEAIGTSEWTGTPLAPLLEEAGFEDDAVEVVFSGLDRGQQDEIQVYQRSLSIDEARREEVLLAYGMNGAPLQPQHGYPLRLIVPGWYGMTSIKWLGRIDAVADPFLGYQMVHSYRYTKSADDPGDAVSLMQVRALMVPPGVPDFLSRNRFVKSGPAALRGRAWAGRRSIARVEVSDDGGENWWEAECGEPAGPHAWTPWRTTWQATPGDHCLCVRATDSNGRCQPVEAEWNYQGMGNNVVQRVAVRVT